MNDIILFDCEPIRGNLLPLTFTRPVALLRQGTLTIAEKWQKAIPGEYSFRVEDPALARLYPEQETWGQALFIAGHILPDKNLADAITDLQPYSGLVKDGELIAYRFAPQNLNEYDGEIRAIRSLTDIFMNNGDELRRDFPIITAGRASQPLDKSCLLIGSPDNLFIEEGAVLTAAVINTTTGPVYIGRDAEVTEGCVIRGPFSLGEGSRLNLGAKVWPDSTVGPHCRVGGEINNIVMLGYSNKAHDGFLGNAVIGEWCNLGAGCVASNLKNNYAKIRLWNYPSASFIKTDLQFCGLIMGDHSKAGINVMFNTATVVGVGCNVYGAGFPRTFIPSFQEGGAATGFKTAILSRFLETAKTVMARRHVDLSDAQAQLLTELYNNSTK